LSLFASLYYFYPSESFNGILSISLIVGAISAASSPAALMSVIHEYKSQGHLTTLLLGITAFSDVITLILYAFALSIAEILVSEATFSFYSGLIEPILSIFFAIVLGVVFGLFIKAIIRYFPKEEVLLGLMLGAVFLIGGVSQKLDFSHLLPIMVFGFFVENFADRNLAQKSYNAVYKIEEPIFGVFFFLAGAHLDLTKAGSALLLVLVVFSSRFLSKYLGTRIASGLTHAKEKVKKYAGLALLPSAGVAIGLILDAQNTLASHISSLANIMLS